MSNLLIENIDASLTESKILSNDDGKEKEYFIEGVFLQAEVKNRNRRIYPRSVMKREADKYIREKILTNRGMGELEHPDSNRDSSINLRYVSHKIISLEERGNDWYGKAKIAHKSGMGALVANLMECGITLGTSSRASGSVKNGIVQNDFRLITPSDIVADPSAPDAIVTSLMEKTWVMENDILTEKDADEIITCINTIDRFDDNKLENAFSRIMAKVNNNLR